MDPAGLGNPVLVQQLTDYLQQDLGFSDAESQYLAQEFADGLQYLSDANQGDSDSSSNESDSSGSDVQGSGADTSDAGSAPSTGTTGNNGTPDRIQGQINDDPAFFWGTVVGLWTIFSGACIAAIGAIGAALRWLGTALAEALATAYAWAGVAVNNIGQRLGSLWQSVLSEAPVVEGQIAPEIGNKLNFIFGEATGSTHNVARSQGLLQELESIGIRNTAVNRQYMLYVLSKTLNDPSNVVTVQESGRVVKESLLWGPDGAKVLQTIWDGARLVTVYIKGAK